MKATGTPKEIVVAGNITNKVQSLVQDTFGK